MLKIWTCLLIGTIWWQHQSSHWSNVWLIAWTPYGVLIPIFQTWAAWWNATSNAMTSWLCFSHFVRLPVLATTAAATADSTCYNCPSQRLRFCWQNIMVAVSWIDLVQSNIHSLSTVTKPQAKPSTWVWKAMLGVVPYTCYSASHKTKQHNHWASVAHQVTQLTFCTGFVGHKVVFCLIATQKEKNKKM